MLVKDNHYCWGSNCFNCHPDTAPQTEVWQEMVNDHKIPTQGLSGIVRKALMKVFDQGLDEGTHFTAIGELSIGNLKEERARVADASLEAEMLDLMLYYFSWQNTGNPPEVPE
jgi:hypothetical protein